VEGVSRRAGRREMARVVGVVLVELKARGGRVRAGSRTREPAVVEVDAHGAVGCHGQVWLELVDIREPVVVDLDRGGPGEALVDRRGEQHIAKAGALRLVANVDRIVVRARLLV